MMKRKKFSIWKILQHWSIPAAILFSLYKGYKEFTLAGIVTWRSLIVFVLVLMCFVISLALETISEVRKK